MAARGTKSKSSSSQGRPKGGRVTPKGGPAAAQAARARSAGKTPSAGSSRYTPPIPRSARSSPPWWPVLMFGLIAIGMLIIFLDYANVLPGGTSAWYLLPALACITGGIIAATYYR